MLKIHGLRTMLLTNEVSAILIKGRKIKVFLNNGDAVKIPFAKGDSYESVSKAIIEAFKAGFGTNGETLLDLLEGYIAPETEKGGSNDLKV